MPGLADGLTQLAEVPLEAVPLLTGAREQLLRLVTDPAAGLLRSSFELVEIVIPRVESELELPHEFVSIHHRVAPLLAAATLRRPAGKCHS